MTDQELAERVADILTRPDERASYFWQRVQTAAMEHSQQLLCPVFLVDDQQVGIRGVASMHVFYLMTSASANTLAELGHGRVVQELAGMFREMFIRAGGFEAVRKDFGTVIGEMTDDGIKLYQ